MMRSPAPRFNHFEKLQHCSRALREHLKSPRSQEDVDSAAFAWLLDNHSFLQSQILETKRILKPRRVRMLPQAGREPRVYRIAADLVAQSARTLDNEAVSSFAPELKTYGLTRSRKAAD